VNEFSISQGSAVTFFRCGGHMRNHLCQSSSELRVPNFIKIGSCLTELFKRF